VLRFLEVVRAGVVLVRKEVVRTATRTCVGRQDRQINHSKKGTGTSLLAFPAVPTRVTALQVYFEKESSPSIR